MRSNFRKNFAKDIKILPTVPKVVENKLGQFVEKSFVLCFVDFMEAKKFRDGRDIQIAFKMFRQRVASFVKFYMQTKPS